MKKKSIFVGALAAVAVGVIGQGCSSKHGSGFGDNGTNNGGVGTEGGDASAGDNAPLDGGNSIGDASFHTDSGLSPDASCATATQSAQRQPVYMLIVLDGSGSMAHTNNGDPAQKWSAVVPALDAFFDDLKTNPDPGFAVGLTVFSDKNDANCTTQYGITTCDGPYATMNVPIALVDSAQADKLHQRIDPTSPVDGTPTVAVLKGQYAAMEAFAPNAPVPPDGKKVVVLMTDGVPNDTSNTPTATLQQQCITMVEQEVTKQITTFVVGVGNYAPLNTDEYDPAFLGQLAQAGGAANAGCDPTTTSDETKMCHFQVTPGNKSAQQLEQDFLAAINAIRGKTSCTFMLDKPDGGGRIDPTKINVVHDDGNGHTTTIPQDPNNGWTYDDPNNPTSVTLHGSACDDVKNESVGSISIVVGCATVVK